MYLFCILGIVFLCYAWCRLFQLIRSFKLLVGQAAKSACLKPTGGWYLLVADGHKDRFIIWNSRLVEMNSSSLFQFWNRRSSSFISFYLLFLMAEIPTLCNYRHYDAQFFQIVWCKSKENSHALQLSFFSIQNEAPSCRVIVFVLMEAEI